MIAKEKQEDIKQSSIISCLLLISNAGNASGLSLELGEDLGLAIYARFAQDGV